jgi:SAM-dependent methyltransferase
MVALYALTIFTSAALLFLAQPMFARMLLPLLGGSPAVWATAMVFYQAILLAGYAYAHASSRLLGVRKQAMIHIAVLSTPLVLLPFAVPPGWVPPAEENPVPWVLGLMSIAIGLPFFAVSATSPLLQKWFADSGNSRAKDPYFLYVASNVGSILALLSYPIFFEPHFRLSQQTWIWTFGYYVFVVLMIGCAIRLWLTPTPVVAMPEPPPGWSRPPVVMSPTPPPARQRWRWFLLSMVPSSLLLGVTSYLSSEIAVVPLMWVVPLALYLLTFIIAFSRRRWVTRATLSRVLPLLLAPVVMLFAMHATQPIGLIVALHLGVFFVAALLCHCQLSDERPLPVHLTEFYLWLSIGGVAGGIFNALLAPMLFNSILEYPLMLGVVCIVGMQGEGNLPWWKMRLIDVVWPVTIAVLTVALVLGVQSLSLESKAGIVGMGFSIGSLGCYFLSRRPLRFVLSAVGILWAGQLYQGELGQGLYAERSFYGVHRVTLDPTGDYHLMIHGQTLHGMQSLDVTRRGEALSYYHRTGPIGEVLDLYGRAAGKKIGVVGLGAGTLAAYAQPGQEWTYFELDPVVAKLANDQRFFTYLFDAQADVDLVMGDARLSLMEEPDNRFDLIVLDAYSSDAIPVHLVTREALRLYLHKLAPGGRLVFHISNLHLDLEPVFANLARDARLVSFTRDDTTLSPELLASGKSPSVWLIMARRASDLEQLTTDKRWQPSRGDKNAVWTDDYSSVLSVFHWQ